MILDLFIFLFFFFRDKIESCVVQILQKWFNNLMICRGNLTIV